MFNGGGVTHIVEDTLDDKKNPGKKFKKIWIYIECYRHDPMMTYFFDTVEKEGTVKVYYEKTQGIERYWKVKILKDLIIR